MEGKAHGTLLTLPWRLLLWEFLKIQPFTSPRKMHSWQAWSRHPPPPAASGASHSGAQASRGNNAPVRGTHSGTSPSQGLGRNRKREVLGVEGKKKQKAVEG